MFTIKVTIQRSAISYQLQVINLLELLGLFPNNSNDHPIYLLSIAIMRS